MSTDLVIARVIEHPRLVLCDRLPTPIPALLSPPLSRSSSPLPAAVPLPDPPQVGKKTSAFFSSPFHRDLPAPAPRLSPDEPEHDAHTANSSFFFAKGSATPTPPPSVHSSVDDGPTAHDRPHLPPLARFFHDTADPAALTASPSAIQTTFPRSLVTLDDIHSLPDSPTELTTPDSPTPKSELPPSSVPPQPLPLPRESDSASQSESESDSIVLKEGTTIGTDTDAPLQLLRELGQGAFSCVWLARDLRRKLEHPALGSRPKSESIARKRGDRSAHGLRPPAPPGLDGSLVRSQSVYFAARDGEGATATVEHDDREGDHGCSDGGGCLVAVKMMDRALCDANDRTRISFVREVEVLRHISHPSIVSYLHSFTTPTHHCLVLEALQGGELFDLLDQDHNHARMTPPLLRRIFGELCQAVGWMHGVGLVHRDVKLENILLTMNPFLAHNPSLPPTPAPLTKLTDFGLARFIDPAHPLLTTRCGSEAYAAPEIITGKPYDGRQTDAWACGVVLFALATRGLPFDRRVGGDTRRGYLMRIAQGEYVWPETSTSDAGVCESDPAVRDSEGGVRAGGDAGMQGHRPTLATQDLKSVVARLLVRDPSKRARVVEVWSEPWMRAEGAPVPPLSVAGRLVGSDIPSVARQEL